MRLLSRKSVATRLDVSVKTLLRMVENGEFPAPTHCIPGQSGDRWMSELVELHLAGFAVTLSRAKTPGQRGTTPDK